MTARLKMLLVAALAAFPALLARQAHATVTGEYTLYANGAPGTPVNFTTNPLMNISQGFCYFTLIQGEFEGGGEGGQLFVGSDGNWRMKVWAQQAGIGFHTRCVTWDSFPGSANHSYTAAPRVDWGTVPYNTPVWGTDSICLLDLLTGQFSDRWEMAGTTSAVSGFAGGPPSPTWLNQGQNNSLGTFMESGTFCAYLGHAAHMVPAGQGGFNFDYRAEGASYDVTMIQASSGICWLNGISGGYDGGGEQASVYLASDGHWHLRQLSQQTDKHTGSMASCAYFQ